MDEYFEKIAEMDREMTTEMDEMEMESSLFGSEDGMEAENLDDEFGPLEL